MKIADSLLVAPLAFCLAGSLLGVFWDVGFSSLCLWITAASGAALTLHWLLGRAGRKGRAAWPAEPAASSNRGELRGDGARHEGRQPALVGGAELRQGDREQSFGR